MMTPEEFLQKLNMPTHMEYNSYYHESSVEHAMKAYALHVLERVEKEAEVYRFGSDIDVGDLKSIFEEIKKDLK